MSLSNLLRPNDYAILCGSITQLAPEVFSAYPSTNQSLSTSATTRIAFDTLLFADSNYDISAKQYVCPVAGKYRFVVAVSQTIVAGGASTATFSINLLNTGAIIRSGNWQSILAAGTYVEDISFELIGQFAAGDIVYVQSQPPTPNTNISSYNVFALSTYFSGELI